MKDPRESYIEFREPTFFRKRERLLWQLYYQVIPCALYMLGVALLDKYLVRWTPYALGRLEIFDSYSWHEIRLIAVVVRLIVFLSPLCLLAVYFVPWLGASRRVAAQFGEADGFVVQVRFIPRRCRGFWGWIDDADDLGLLRVESELLTLSGDGIEMEVRREDIASASQRNVGWRMLWLAGEETRIDFTHSIEGIAAVVFSSRGATTLPGVRKLNRSIALATRALIA